MKELRAMFKLSSSLCCLLIFTAPAAPARNTFRAGAARIDITPGEKAALPMSGYAGRTEGHTGIYDHLYARAVVIDDGRRQAAIIGVDLSAIGEPLWQSVSARISREAGIPVENILLSATHTHAGPALGKLTDDPNPRSAAYAGELQDKLASVVKEARAALRPARVGMGSGRVNVNVNRRARMLEGGYWLGKDPDGPSDKTLAVLKFESLDGKLIALLMNYGVHATVLPANNMMISGDLAGAASRFVEEQLGAAMVAPWTSGAAGDQAPIYNRAPNANDAYLIGRLMGEEAIRVSKGIRMSATAPIRAAQKVVSCPGRKTADGGRRRKDLNYAFVDAPPVNIRLSLLRIGDIALAGVSGEVLTMIGQSLKKQSPLANTVLIANCNGASGYLADDDAYSRISYEIVVTKAKPGCAEKAITGGLLDLMEH